MSPQQRVPPQDLEAEESVLGAMLLSSGALSVVSEIIVADDFYRHNHGLIFQACLDLDNRGEPVDALTVVNYLDGRGELETAGGKAKIHELAALVPATANAAHYARIVREQSILRGLVRAGAEITRLGMDRPGDTHELIERAENALSEIQRETGAEPEQVGPIAERVWRRAEQMAASGGELIGIPTGFPVIDKLTLGLQPGNMVVVAARPSMGKSALALNLVNENAVRRGLPTVMFTLEMSKVELGQRLLCMGSRLNSQDLAMGALDGEGWRRLSDASSDLSRAPLYIEDTAYTVTEMRAKARQVKRKHGLGLVVVDYMQLMAAAVTNENRVQQVSEISRSLKALARSLDVPVVALSQLSRQVEGRVDKRPMLSDLRESGSIEQDADLVLFIYRDEYYNPESEHAGTAELILSKNRNGPTGWERVSFVKRYASFSALSHAGVPLNRPIVV